MKVRTWKPLFPPSWKASWTTEEANGRPELWHIVTIPKGDEALEDKYIDVRHDPRCPKRTFREMFADQPGRIEEIDERVADVDVPMHDCAFEFMLSAGGFESIMDEDPRQGMFRVLCTPYKSGGWEFPNETDIAITVIPLSFWERFLYRIGRLR